MCVRCPWALQAERSCHYYWRFFSLLLSLSVTFLPEAVKQSKQAEKEIVSGLVISLFLPLHQ
jgi:hypothetical protein